MEQNQQKIGATPAIFDYAFLEHCTSGDLALMRELIDMFRVQVERSGRDIVDCLTDACWKFQAHTLKGAAAAVGAVEIHMLASIIEEKPCPRRILERENARQMLAVAAKAYFAEADKVLKIPA